jgi:hypothetical protein
MSTEQLILALDLFRVHCFTCPHFVEERSPDLAHAAMEHHYDEEHAAYIGVLAGQIR